jgi:hypothetical protein
MYPVALTKSVKSSVVGTEIRFCHTGSQCVPSLEVSRTTATSNWTLASMLVIRVATSIAVACARWVHVGGVDKARTSR